MSPQEEKQLIRESGRGKQAEAWIKDPMTQEAFETVRAGIIERWAASPVEDKEGQYTLRLMLKILADLKGNIEHVAMTGAMAEIQIKQEKEQKSRVVNFLNRWGVRA